MKNKCASYEDGCEEWAGCPCVYYKEIKNEEYRKAESVFLQKNRKLFEPYIDPKNDEVTEEQLMKEGNEIGGYYDDSREKFKGMKYKLTDEMKKDRLNCGEDADCNECSCQIGTDDCIYNHITTVADYIKKMNNNQLTIYLHSWQVDNMSVEEIKDLLNSECMAEDVSV